MLGRAGPVLPLVIALRLVIHIYYGWGSLFVLLWIPARYALYRASGSIWPLIVAHAVYDGIQFSIDAWPTAKDVLGLVNLSTAVLGAAGALVGSVFPPRADAWMMWVYLGLIIKWRRCLIR